MFSFKDAIDLGITAAFAFAVLRELRWFRKDTTTELRRIADKQVVIETKLEKTPPPVTIKVEGDGKVIPWNGSQQ